MLNNTTGAKIKQVSGYPGTREITLAIEKNEVHGLCGFSWSSAVWSSFKFFPPGLSSESAALPLIEDAMIPLLAVVLSLFTASSCPAFGEFGPVTTSTPFAPRSRASIVL